MKALQITAPGQYEIAEVPIPKPDQDEVLMEIEIVATCPRWDIHMMGGKHMFDPSKSPDYPLPYGWPGHEAAGIVKSVGSKVTRFKVGDRIAAFDHIAGTGAYAQYLAYKEHNLISIPDNVTFKQATSFELLKCVVQGMMQFGDIRGGTMLVSGLGPAGMLAIQLARIWGASRVIGVDLNRDRIEYVKSLGLGEVAHVDDIGDERFEYGYDCVGYHASIQNVLDHTSRHVVIFGVQKGDVIFRDVSWGSGLKLETFRGRPASERERELLLDAVANHGLDTECIQTHHIPFTRYKEAVALLTAQEAIKVHFLPKEDFGA